MNIPRGFRPDGVLRGRVGRKFDYPLSLSEGAVRGSWHYYVSDHIKPSRMCAVKALCEVLLLEPTT